MRPGGDLQRARRLARELTTLTDGSPEGLRHRLLAALLTLVEADVAAFYTIGVRDGRSYLKGYQGIGSEINTRCRAGLASDAGTRVLNDTGIRDYARPRLLERTAFVEDTALWDTPTFLESSVYADLLAPAGIRHQQRLLAYHGGKFLGWVGLARAPGTEPFTPRDRRRLGPLVRPAVTALLTAERLERAGQPEEAGEIVVSPAGRVLHASRPGRAWLAVPGFRERLALAVREVDRSATEIANRLLLGGDLSRIVRLDGQEGVRYLVHTQPLERLGLHPDAALTPKQRQVAEYAAAGATVRETARELGLSVETVRTHLRGAYQRLEVSSRVELARALFPEGRS